MGVPLITKIDLATSPLLAIILLYLAILRSGAQSVIMNRNARRSDDSDKYKGVGQ